MQKTSNNIDLFPSVASRTTDWVENYYGPNGVKDATASIKLEF